MTSASREQGAAPDPVQTILVATDFSESSTAARGWARELAQQHSARVVLVHVLLPQTPLAPEFVPMPQQYYDGIRQDTDRRLAAELAELHQGGLSATSEVLVGSAAAGILEAADKHRADLLVAGTRGRTGWKRLLLGSTAARLVRDARCPVLTIHPTDAGTPRPVGTVLVPTDFSADAALAAEAAARILGEAGDQRRLVLLHAFRLPLDTAHLPSQILGEALRRAEETARHDLEALAATLSRPGLTIDRLVCEGYPPEVIVEQARGVAADLVAMGTHGRSGLDRLLVGSTAERVLPSAPCPVLTVRRPPEG